MHQCSEIQLSDVQNVYSGPEFKLWELLMGQQVHVGGLQSSETLAEAAGIHQESVGVDLCCCTGAGMRYLIRHRQVQKMIGVDATAAVVELGLQRCREEGFVDQIELVVADACATGLANHVADFVWGEDAWCYVVDKTSLIEEAARLVKPGGVIAFTDWVEGATEMSDAEAQRLLRFMKFPNLQNLDGYAQLLAANQCQVTTCEETGLFTKYIDFYLSMLQMQLTSDALRIVGYNEELFQSLGGEMAFMRQLAQEGKIVQGRVVARKNATSS